MTTKDFVSNLKAFRKANIALFFTFICWSFGGLAALVVIDTTQYAGRLQLSVFIIWLIHIIALGWIVSRTSSKKAERLGVLCPYCRVDLSEMKTIVIASGHCGRCGGRVLDGIEPVSNIERESKSTFEANVELVAEMRSIKWLMIVGVFCLVFIPLLQNSDKTNVSEEIQQQSALYGDKINSFIEAREWNRIISLAQDHQKLYPHDATGYLHEGMAHYYGGEYELSIPLFEKMIKVDYSSKASADKWIQAARKKIFKGRKRLLLTGAPA